MEGNGNKRPFQFSASRERELSNMDAQLIVELLSEALEEYHDELSVMQEVEEPRKLNPQGEVKEIANLGQTVNSKEYLQGPLHLEKMPKSKEKLIKVRMESCCKTMKTDSLNELLSVFDDSTLEEYQVILLREEKAWLKVGVQPLMYEPTKKKT